MTSPLDTGGDGSESVPDRPSKLDTPVDLSMRLALTLGEAARTLGISERHLRTFLPEIPHVYLGRKPVVPVDALRTWLEQQAKAEGNRVDAAVQEVLTKLDGAP